MAILRSCSAFLWFILAFELDSLLGSLAEERPSRSTGLLLTGANSLSSSSKTVTNQAPPVSIVYLKCSER